MNGCPNDEVLALHLDGELPPAERMAVAAHLRRCEECRRLVGALAVAQTRTSSYQDSPIFASSTWKWRTGARVDRLVILGPLGRGGMGEVYEAHDLDLDRRVAVKVARIDDARDHERLRDEARAMARFNHPNVVRVFDVGEHDGATYFVLERAPGQTLRHWLNSSERPVRQVLDQFVELAGGCAALHDAGLVHRDIKPGNVLVSASGKAMLGDFGLVGPTKAGRYGTPGFMAPEVESGGASTARSDQYSFCVTLRGALERCRGRVPRSVRRAIARGTHPDPARRFDSMGGLAHELRPRSRRAYIAVAALPLLGLLPAWGEEHACDWAETPWEGSAAQPDVEQYQETWTRVATEACSVRVDDEIRSCLLAQRRDAEALLSARDSSDAMVNSLWATFEPQLCMSDAAADNVSARVRELVERSHTTKLGGDMQQAQELAAQAATLAHEHGGPRDALLALRNAARLALDVGDLERSRERYEAAYWVGLQLDAPAETADAALGVMNAFNLELDTSAARLWYRNATSALDRMPVEDHKLWLNVEVGAAFMHQNAGDLDASVDAAKRALAHGGRIPEDPAAAGLEITVGETMTAAGDWREAQSYYQRGLESLRTAFGADSFPYTNALGTYGAFCGNSLGDHECAADYGLRSLRGIEEAGVRGVFVPLAYADVALALIELGRVEEANVYVEKATALFEEYFPAEHPQRIWVFKLGAEFALARGEFEEARRIAEEGVQLANRGFGPDDGNTGGMISTLAEVLLAAGDAKEARRRYDEALRIAERAIGPQHPGLALTLLGRADALSALGDRDAAERAYRRVLALDIPEPWRDRANQGLAGS